MAILPHSEHSLSATKSFASVGPSMMNSEEAGREEGVGDEPPGDEGGEGGSDCAASCMSAKAATAFATT